MEATVELGPVRPGEQLDWEALAAYLRTKLDIDGWPGRLPMEVLQFPNGSANLTYRVTFGDRHLVIRRPPFGQLAPGAHDMKREHRVLSATAGHDHRALRGADRDRSRRPRVVRSLRLLEDRGCAPTAASALRARRQHRRAHGRARVARADAG